MVARETLASSEQGSIVVGGSLSSLLAGYRRQLLREERSPRTIRSYAWALKDFLTYLIEQDISDGGQITRDVIDGWQDATREHLGASSRSLASAAVRGFLRWAAEREAVDGRSPNWLAKVRHKQRRPRPIPREDLVKLVQHLQREARLDNPTVLRDYALLLYLLTTGARVSEVLQVRRDCYERAIVVQKGGTEKELIIPPIVTDAIVAYLGRRTDPLPWLWVTLNETPRLMGPAGVREVWRRLAKRVRITPFTTHQVRHTNATELLEAGVPAPTIAEELGHHDLSTLKNYGQVTAGQRQVAVDAMQRLVEQVSDPEAARALRPRLLPRLKRSQPPNFGRVK